MFLNMVEAELYRQRNGRVTNAINKTGLEREVLRGHSLFSIKPVLYLAARRSFSDGQKGSKNKLLLLLLLHRYVCTQAHLCIS